jgi:hypothetical protein
MIKAVWIILMIAASGFVLPVTAAAAELTGTHGDWKTYRHGAGESRMCFAVATAEEASPVNGQRDKPHVYVTAWPTAGIKAEISVLLGFSLKRGAEIEVDVGGTAFTLLADDDRAFVADTGDEARLLDAMRRGRVMTVSGVSSAGLTSKDSYSLLGVTAAIQAIASDCQ